VQYKVCEKQKSNGGKNYGDWSNIVKKMTEALTAVKI
jgi:hypothetical protein